MISKIGIATIFVGSMGLPALAEQVKAPVEIWTVINREPDLSCEIEDIISKQAEQATSETKAVVDEKQKAIESQKNIAQNAEEKRKNGDFRIETGLKRTGFSLDLPETVIKFDDKKIDTVEVAVKRTALQMVVPGQCSIGKWDVPEFRGLSVRMVTQDILVPCPKTRTITLDLPQFKSGQTTIRVPEATVRMVRKDVSFNVPQFTYRDFEKDEDSALKKIDAETVLLNRAVEEIKTRHKGVTAEAIRRTLKDAETEMMGQIDAAQKATIEPNRLAYIKLIEARKAGVEALRQAGVKDPEAEFPFEDTVGQFWKYELKLREPFDDARANVNEMILRLAHQYLDAVVAEVGEEGFCGPIPRGTPATVLPQ